MKRREVLANLLASCNSGKSVAQLHSQTLKAGLFQDGFFATKLNALYAKYESLVMPARCSTKRPTELSISGTPPLGATVERIDGKRPCVYFIT
ncbi:hypothetical protein ACFX2I_023283 [Malus domestica]